MKILHTVEFYAPAVGGAEEVVRQLSERMAARGHDVTVATTKLPQRAATKINGVTVEEFDIAGNAVRGYRGKDVERYRAFLRNSDFDVVMNYAAQEWTADLFFEEMGFVSAKKILVPCGFSALYDPLYVAYFQRMPDILARYDATVYLAENYRDVALARDHGIKNMHLIPNGAGLDEFGERSEDEAASFRARHAVEGLLVTTIGNHTGGKGHRETIRAFLRARTGPATLLIVGGSFGVGCHPSCRRWERVLAPFSRITRKQVRLLRLPRDETVAALKATDVFLFLSNIECSPIVLFEAAAAGVPFVASAAGNSAEIAAWTGGGLIVDGARGAHGLTKPSVHSAARALEKLAADPERRRELGASARAAWLERFTWEKIADEYLALYANLVGRR